MTGSNGREKVGESGIDVARYSAILCWEMVFVPAIDWPFDQAPNVAAITTRQVLKDGLPVLRVTHYSDDNSWAFVCGTTNATEDGRVIGMGEALTLDPTLRTIADLPPGWTAWRKDAGAKWQCVANSQA